MFSLEGACRWDLFLVNPRQHAPEFHESAVNHVLVEGLSTLPNDYQFFSISREYEDRLDPHQVANLASMSRAFKVREFF